MSPVVKASLKERPLSFNKTIAKLQISDLEIQIRWYLQILSSLSVYY